MSISKVIFFSILTIVTTSLMSCGNEVGSQPAVLTAISTPLITKTQISLSEVVTATMNNSLLATPQSLLAEEPLATKVPDSDRTWTVPSIMSKQKVAVSLSTTINVLDWFNPGLSDPVPAGTIVAIPRQYPSGQDETLVAIAKQLGLAIELLTVVNPTLNANTPLQEGTLVVVPKLYIVPKEVTLETVAITLHVGVQALQTFNPGLVGKTTVPANTVLVTPLTESEVQP